MSDFFQQMLSLARRYPLMVTSITVLLLMGGANYYLWERDKELAVRHEDVRVKGEATLNAVAGHVRLTAELATVSDALKHIDDHLVAEGDLAENLGYFYQIETASHLRLSQLNQLSSLPSAEDNPYKAVPFSLRVSGSFGQLVNFLRELETGPRLLRIKRYSFTRAEIKENLLTLDLSLELLGSKK